MNTGNPYTPSSLKFIGAKGKEEYSEIIVNGLSSPKIAVICKNDHDFIPTSKGNLLSDHNEKEENQQFDVIECCLRSKLPENYRYRLLGRILHECLALQITTLQHVPGRCA